MANCRFDHVCVLILNIKSLKFLHLIIEKNFDPRMIHTWFAVGNMCVSLPKSFQKLQDMPSSLEISLWNMFFFFDSQLGTVFLRAKDLFGDRRCQSEDGASFVHPSFVFAASNFRSCDWGGCGKACELTQCSFTLVMQLQMHFWHERRHHVIETIDFWLKSERTSGRSWSGPPGMEHRKFSMTFQR